MFCVGFNYFKLLTTWMDNFQWNRVLFRLKGAPSYYQKQNPTDSLEMTYILYMLCVCR